VLSFGKLVTNEWLKLSKRRSFFIPYLVIAVFTIGIAYFIVKLGSGEDITSQAFVQMMLTKNGLGQLVAFLIIIGTAGVVSKEYSLGTIKLLLIRAQSRSKILLSKYITVLLYAISLMVFTLLVSVVTGSIAFETGAQGTGWNEVIQSFLYTLAYAGIYATITFMIGVLTRSTGITVGATMSMIMLESLIVFVLAKYSFTKYLIFANADLSQYAEGGSPLTGMTMTFSLIVIAVYIALFLIASFVTFKKRDVA
jgi:ABC-2 type transport system permease protein